MTHRATTKIGLTAVLAALALLDSACGTSAINDQPRNQIAAEPTAEQGVPVQDPTPPPAPTAPPTAIPASEPAPTPAAPPEAPDSPAPIEDGPEADETEPQGWEASPFREAFFDASEIAGFLGGTWNNDYIDVLEAETASPDGPCGLALPPQNPGIEAQFFEWETDAEFAQTIQVGDQAQVWVDTMASLIDCEGDFLGVEQVNLEVPGADHVAAGSSPSSATERFVLVAGASVDDVFVGFVIFADDNSHFPTTDIVEEMMARALNRAVDAAA